MYTVALFGAGKIGDAITALLSASGRYTIKVCDQDPARAAKIADGRKNASGHGLKLQDSKSTKELLKGSNAVISALPFHCNKEVATIAHEMGIHYLDLTEDVATSQFIATLAQTGSSCFMPQCGLAPGFISIAAHHLVKMFEKVETVKMRVGALPIYPTNRLKYNLTWSTEGLINEYANACEIIQGGKRVWVVPLEGYESFSLDGNEYESFNTSGGLGTLCATLDGKVKDLNYKSVRYPGHRELMLFLMKDLGFENDRDALRVIFERSIPTTTQDKCVILVEASGLRNGRFEQKTYASTVYNQSVNGQHFGAIQVTTASGICAPLDILLSGKLGNKRGLVRIEEVLLTDFLANEFGRYYRDDKALGSL